MSFFFASLLVVPLALRVIRLPKCGGPGHDGERCVTAGLTFPWSSGSVEGNINRIKMLKRQMYGRASPALLRLRILLAD